MEIPLHTPFHGHQVNQMLTVVIPHELPYPLLILVNQAQIRHYRQRNICIWSSKVGCPSVTCNDDNRPISALANFV